MNGESTVRQLVAIPDRPFADVPATPGMAFNLLFYAAVARLMERAAQAYGSMDVLFEHFPFLAGYWEELSAQDFISGDGAIRAHALLDEAAAGAGHAPLRALCEAAGLDREALLMLLTLGLPEEDARFGSLFEGLQGAPGRPTMGLLTAWWQTDDPGEARSALKRLHASGLVQVLNPEAPRGDWMLAPPTLIWDAIRGEAPPPGSWLRYRPPAELVPYGDLILPEALRGVMEAVPPLLQSGEAQALIVRGPQHNGRRTVLGTVARTLGRGALEIQGAVRIEEDRWRLVGPLATLLHALPVLVLDLAPGETAELPPLTGYIGPLGIVLGRQGGVSGPGAERALAVTLPMPNMTARRIHWEQGLTCGCEDLETISGRFRLTSGNIRRAARLARSYAALDGRTVVTVSDAQAASRALNRQALDTLAVPLASTGDWSHLAVGAETLQELAMLESRCRRRERLHEAVGEVLGAQLNSGVRALFSGPSGTGKTLAARLLASVLQMDLYRLDLSSVVNKYIGETEKSLNQVFARAEELDVILLLDEGDSLLTQRTSVQSSNDRYANLETNYLLQRLEAFEGILIVTTNAGQRIDSAFQRRMDVVISFGAPDVAERWAIWQLHLPSEHAVDGAMLEEVAHRCSLSGGQIRNAALHASLLALNDGGVVTSTHLQAAVQREYRKSGTVCPLPLIAARLDGR